MGELLEVVFEEIPKPKVYKVLSILLERTSEIIEIWCSKKNIEGIATKTKEKQLTKSEVNAVINSNHDSALLINLKDLKINKTTIPSVFMRVMKYDGKFDIDFNFEAPPEKKPQEIMNKIHHFATKISEENKIKHWFGGIEPASDIDTRYFTDREPGPLADC